MNIEIRIMLFVIIILLILNYNKTENMSNTDIKKNDYRYLSGRC